MTAAENATSSQILDIAEKLVQTRGFNGFSYADISIELGITKASLHYHFPTKAALGQRLVQRYTIELLSALRDIEKRHSDARGRLRAYADIYVRTLKSGRMCLCGMLAADYGTLPDSIQAGVRQFFICNERWLTGVLKRGRSRGEVAFAGSPEAAAHALISALEGAMLLARASNDVRRFCSLSKALTAAFKVAPRQLEH